MTREQIEEVFERVRTWPIERQEDVAVLLLALEDRSAGVYHLDEEELADIEEAEREAERGEFATDGEVKALFDRYRRS